jgi:hypothetical protein
MRDLKTGFSYNFTATAYDSSMSALFVGSASFTVQKDVMAALHIVMQQVVKPGTVHVTAPFISSIRVSDTNPSVGEALQFMADVRDVDGSETYSWSSSCNPPARYLDVFSNSSATATGFTSWCVGTETITFSVTTPSTTATVGRSLTSTVQFTLSYAPQGFNADIGINSWPDILGITVIDGGNSQPSPGETISVFANATDADGDTLSYAWTNDCGGTFAPYPPAPLNDSYQNFVAPTSPEQCNIFVHVDDGKGGTNDATLTLNVGGASIPNAIVGPVYPPPGNVTRVDSGDMGRVGGLTWSFSNFNPPPQVAGMGWGPSSVSAPHLALDGTVDAASETLQFDPSQSNLAGGILVFTGSTSIVTVFNGTVTVPTRLTLKVSAGGTPSDLMSPTQLALPASIGGLVFVQGPFDANMLMEGLWNGMWTPVKDLYDNAATPSTATSQVIIDFTAGFYYQPR